jgi:hypothetical protein
MRKAATILSVLAMALVAAGGCSSSPATSDGPVKKEAGRSDKGPSPDGGGTIDSAVADGHVTADAAKDGTTTTTCPSSFQKAVDVTVGSPGTAVQGTITDPSTSACFYKFTGKKGDRIVAFTEAKPQANPFDPTYLDTVVTLFDSNQKQLAQNDDPTEKTTNDAMLFTMLPADGTYYLQMAECNAVKGSQNCAPASGITNKDFSLTVNTLSYAWVVGETAEPNDTTANAATIPYTKSGSDYVPSLLWGMYNTTSDVDVFTIKLPSDTTIETGTRSKGYLYVEKWGTDNDGSTAPIGKIWIVDPSDTTTTHRVAEIDATAGTEPGDLSAPLELNKTYYLFVSRGTGAAGANDFYYIRHFGGSGNPLEQSEGAGASFTPKNDTPTTAQALTASSTKNTSFFIEGDISATADVDYFSAAIPSGLANKTVSVVCGAQRNGSGLRGVKASVFASNGTTPLTSTATATETATADLLLEDLPLGSETSKIVLKIEATQTSDANITSTFYLCGVHFN